MPKRRILLPTAVASILFATSPGFAQKAPDFQREIRPILSNNCFHCHGPDEKERKGGKHGYRLDTAEGAFEDLDGVKAIVPGKPEDSEVFQRITTGDEDDQMPPRKSSKKLTEREVGLLRAWIQSGAKFANHWSYVKPVRSEVPERSAQSSVLSPQSKDPNLRTGHWAPGTNPIDSFILAQLDKEKLSPQPEADRITLARRLALDLTGLPPTPEEADVFAADNSPDAYGKLVDRLLGSAAYGEHWARVWLDLARYADSTGYPSDQSRDIWAYRDWVIRALNANMPFDRFTIEQLAGDLLPGAKEDQLIATAFHRNTMTNNEGGTIDEEFRTYAVVDRVNTTMAVWMGTSFACAQCHTHKYDPITQHEYFQIYAFLNQTADADRKDESPLLEFYTPEKAEHRRKLGDELAALEKKFASPSPQILAGVEKWERGLPLDARWDSPRPTAARSSAGTELRIADDASIFAAKAAATDTYSVEIPLGGQAVPSAQSSVRSVQNGARDEGLSTEHRALSTLAAIRIEALANAALPGNGPGYSGGNFVLSQVRAEIVPDQPRIVKARHLRIEKPGGKHDFLALAEVEVFSGTANVARKGKANQISTFEENVATRAIDGKTDGAAEKGKSVSVTGGGESPQWWEVDLGAEVPIDRIVVWRRKDKGPGVVTDGLKLTLLDGKMQPVWETDEKRKFAEREEISVSGRREVLFGNAFADASQQGFDPRDVIADKTAPDKGWALAGFTGANRTLTLLPRGGVGIPKDARLLLTLVQSSQWADHTLGAFRIATTDDARVARLASIPSRVLSALSVQPAQRTAEQATTVADFYVRNSAPELKAEQQRAASAAKELAALKPDAVPVMRELDDKQHRVTKVQLRGSWRDLGDEVQPGTPVAFPPLPAGPQRDRLALARWIVSRDNPLTARVTVNRLWEHIFGTGIVRTSEEFGAQGDLPSHPELLDWLAVELMESGWDMKHILRLLVNSQTYRQSATVTPQLAERDPENRLLARGPRFRPSGELLRDQALAISGLLSLKMYGPGVRPLAPDLGLKTAFGRSNDWATSEGEDRHRRSVYTEVRRNNPYASFATFDAPNREVCTIRRSRSNTPLQAFVTLNDPVFIEAAQALARRIWRADASPESIVTQGFRLCAARPPTSAEVSRLVKLHADALASFRTDEKSAVEFATNPLGPLPKDADAAQLAAWTTVANVLLNLDETLMRR